MAPQLANPELTDIGLGAIIIIGLVILYMMIPELLKERRIAKAERRIFELCHPQHKSVRKS